MDARPLTLADLPDPPPGRSGWPWTDAAPPAASADLPRITVVTPSFNQGEFLEETIRSVLLQGYPNLQYLVVDGGSTDRSVDVIRRYERHLACWVSERDRGHTHALNKGFARADGEVYAFLNSDDYYEPGALLAAGRAISPERPWVVGRVRYLDEQGRTWPLPACPGREVAPWFLHCPVAQPGAFWRADLHRRAGPFDESFRFFFDYEFWMRLRFGLGAAPTAIDAPVAVYRLHAESKTVAQNDGFLADARAIRAAHEPGLSRGDRARVAVARHRRRACGFASRAKAAFAAGRPVAGLGHMAGGVVRWPPLLVDRRARAALRRVLTGRRAAPADEPPVVWDYYAD